MECYEGNRYENMLRDFSMACVEQGLIDPKYVIDEDTGNEVTIPPPFPTEWSICDCCRGDGAHALYGIAIVADDWNEWHDDEKSDYLTGAYDTSCGECGGTGKVRIIKFSQLPPGIELYWNEWNTEQYYIDQISTMERMMGA